MELSILDILIAIIIVAIGTSIQTALGFGLAMIAAPLLLLLDRALVPGPLIVAALTLVVWMAYKEREAIDLSTFKVALLGRCLGTPPAAWLLGTMSAAAFDLIFGGLVLLAVAISLIHGNIRPTPRAVFFATIASGFMSTISSIGGPPVALVYQNSKGPELRANLSVLFILGCTISLIALMIIGRFKWADFQYAGVLIIGVILGVLISGPVKKMLDRQAVRPYLLGLCFISASLVIIKALND